MSKETVYAYEFGFNGKRRKYLVGAKDQTEAEYWFFDYLKHLLNIIEKVAEFENDPEKNINDLIDEGLNNVEWEDYYSNKDIKERI